MVQSSQFATISWLLPQALRCASHQSAAIRATVDVAASRMSLPSLLGLLHMQGSTFGIPGVEKYAHFLRDVSHTTQIRSQLIDNWNRANIPGNLALPGALVAGCDGGVWKGVLHIAHTAYANSMLKVTREAEYADRCWV